MDNLILKAVIQQDDHWVDWSALLKAEPVAVTDAVRVVLLSLDQKCMWLFFFVLIPLEKLTKSICFFVVHLKACSRQLPAASEKDLAALLATCYDYFTFPHSFSLYTHCMLLPHAYYFLFTFLFPSTDFLFFHVQPYCLRIASCTVLHSLLTNAQPTQAQPCYTIYKDRIDSSIWQLVFNRRFLLYS